MPTPHLVLPLGPKLALPLIPLLLLLTSDASPISGSLSPLTSHFYTFSFSSPPLFVLKTECGDADLYVSNNYTHPSYEKYDLQSATTDVEILQTPSYFTSPVRVGVFGAMPYVLTNYTLHLLSNETDLSINSESSNVSEWLENITAVAGFVFQLVIEILTHL